MAYHFSLVTLSLRMLERNLAMNKIKMPSSLARKTTDRGQQQREVSGRVMLRRKEGTAVKVPGSDTSWALGRA